MRFDRYLAPFVSVGLLACLSAHASHLVTGNGFGFAVVSPENASVTGFYAHPYSFVRPDPKNPPSEGVETGNFIKTIALSGKSGQAPSREGTSAEYEEDSQVIHARRSDGEGFCFMPFGLGRTALIFSWGPSSGDARGGGLYVEWSRPVSSQRDVRVFGAEVHLLKFDGIEESLLLIPLGAKRVEPSQPQQALSGSLAWALISLESESQTKQVVSEFYTWRAGLAPRALAKREITEMERWRAKLPVTFAGEKERTCGGKVK